MPGNRPGASHINIPRPVSKAAMPGINQRKTPSSFFASGSSRPFAHNTATTSDNIGSAGKM
ncbi:hypothetical protein D9M68_886660 [compost metagenome]